MNQTVEPATARQLEYLREHGFTADYPLSKAEAVELIRSLFTHPGAIPHERRGPLQYRQRVEGARRALETGCVSELADARQRLELAIDQREEFWRDTCRDGSELPHGSPEALELYRTRGCCFCTPSRGQVQAVLEALDSAVPDWDTEHAELFYDTLLLNFPELQRRACA
jgi:hypothetical protein